MTGDVLEIVVDGEPVATRPGTTVAVALMNARRDALRQTIAGAPRGVLCGMGICFECRVMVNGVRERRACLVRCEPGMVVETGRRT